MYWNISEILAAGQDLTFTERVFDAGGSRTFRKHLRFEPLAPAS
jgi:hypothetical protein